MSGGCKHKCARERKTAKQNIGRHESRTGERRLCSANAAGRQWHVPDTRMSPLRGARLSHQSAFFSSCNLWRRAMASSSFTAPASSSRWQFAGLKAGKQIV
eukprot:UN2327